MVEKGPGCLFIISLHTETSPCILQRAQHIIPRRSPHMIPWCEVMYHEEYRTLCAIVGRGKVSSPEKWPEWQRLQDKYGWKVLNRAAERVEPEKRWSANIETLCMQLKTNEIEAEKEAITRERIASTPKPVNSKESAALFASIRKRVGV